MRGSSILSVLSQLGSRAPGEARERTVEDLPVPVFWMLGKAQAGKSSIVREITGVSLIEIGEGFKACTKTSSLYAFPNEQAPLLYFMDTRGLFESGYDAAEDIAFCEDKAHVILAVVKATDHALDGLIAALEGILRRHPEWPLVVAQTCLHEAYPRGTAHVVPYPFGDPSRREAIPIELRHHLDRQREIFSRLTTRFVEIDFTKQEDGLHPADYGRERLVSTLHDLLPEINRNIIRQLELSREHGARFRAAQPYLISYSLLAGSVAAIPVPLIDLPGVTAVELKMLHSIAKLYGERLSYGRIVEISSLVGAGFVARMGGREILKLVPGGSVGTALFVAASTYAMGSVFCAYFGYIKEGKKPDRAALQRLLEEQLHVGQKLFARWYEEKRSDRKGAV